MSLLFNNKNPRDEVIGLFAQSADPMASAVEWAYSVSANAGLDPVKDQVQLIKELRLQEPSLDLKAARYLAEKVAADGS